MQYRQLGRTGIEVSTLCLGTMTFGNQVSETDAHRQMDLAFDAGVNFLDVAEMYPFPAEAATQGESERIIGSWIKARANRDGVIVASKASGPAEGWLTWINGGHTGFDRANLERAVDASLQRLQLDCIDLYQLHWPERSTNYFGRLGYQHSLDEGPVTPFEDVLGVLGEFVVAGKVRAVGLSNETPWGVMQWLHTAERLHLPRMASVQNPYNLLNRSYEVGLAEVSHREDCGLLAYSPLAFGVLTGKYSGDVRPPGSRLALFPQYGRYSTPVGLAAADAYVELARRHGLSPAGMALAYINSRGFVTSNIITATSDAQLAEDLASADLELSEEVLAGIEAIHSAHPNPCP